MPLFTAVSQRIVMVTVFLEVVPEFPLLLLLLLFPLPLWPV
jgi:hypothetical protein